MKNWLGRREWYVNPMIISLIKCWKRVVPSAQGSWIRRDEKVPIHSLTQSYLPYKGYFLECCKSILAKIPSELNLTSFLVPLVIEPYSPSSLFSKEIKDSEAWSQVINPRLIGEYVSSYWELNKKYLKSEMNRRRRDSMYALPRSKERY